MNVVSLILEAAAQGASDIHLICGLPPKVRAAGQLRSLEGVACLAAEDCAAAAEQLAGDRLQCLRERGELDGSATLAGVRVRSNIFRQQGRFSIALRLLADRIPPLTSLGLPPKAEELADLRRGVVLVTGETGSGKSTTLAAMIDCINHRRAAHVITLEDPIEYLYVPDRCIFNQREIGRDTESFATGLRAALREDPDILLVGELRDLDTIETALQAAETGHLVLGTLHTTSAADSIDRMVDVFPETRQRQIRMQLSQTLQAVLTQQLLPTRDGSSRMAACELMVVNAAIRNLIREGKTPQIASAVATSGAQGAVTMDNAILGLYQAGKISRETALAAARDPEYLKRTILQH